jgi:hypothetical protein
MEAHSRATEALAEEVEAYHRGEEAHAGAKEAHF